MRQMNKSDVVPRLGGFKCSFPSVASFPGGVRCCLILIPYAREAFRSNTCETFRFHVESAKVATCSTFV